MEDLQKYKQRQKNFNILVDIMTKLNYINYVLSHFASHRYSRINIYLFPLIFVLNPFMSSGLFYLKSLDRSISYMRGAWFVFIIVIFC